MKKNLLSKSAMLLRDTYQLYAKMLAVENIKVVFDEAISAPAQFDILNRVLYISPVHQAQAHLIPGLVVHEVGHALYSTLTEAEAKKIKRITKLLNIIDDGYQERMICKKYNGAKKHLFTVFEHFFIKEGDLAYVTPNQLVNIVNILNYNCKGFKHGYSKPYPSYVLPEDVVMLREAESINVHSLIKRNDFAKALAKVLKKYGVMDDDGQDLVKGKGDKESSDDKGEGDDTPLMDDEDAEGEDDSEDGESSDGSEPPDKKKQNDEDAVEDILEENKDELNDHHEKFKHQMNGAITFELPSGKELLAISEVVDLYEKGNLVDQALLETNNLCIVDKFKASVKESKRIAAQMFTKFNMRVQASNYANTQFKKSGTLDPERAALYQVYDDVFMKTAIDQHQPNHAYTIMLDWSGSMDSSIFALALRIMELVYFAKSAGVEIEVWLYTTSFVNNPAACERNIVLTKSKFIKILNSKKNSPMELDQRLKHLWVTAHEISSSPKIKGAKANEFIRRNNTAGTNILEGLILGHHQLSLMEADIKTCFILSDGSDTTSFDFGWDAAKKKSVNLYGNQTLKLYVGGIDVNFLYNDSCTRVNATTAIADMYLAAGQRTTAIAWNCPSSGMTRYAQNVVSTGSTMTNDKYIHADNSFIDEIVKNLL
jgi:hypothetical protein